MEINSSEFSINDNLIKIGLTKDYFIKNFNIKSCEDSLEICNMEGLICIDFLFYQDKLKSISYNCKYID